ncbi:hypothetical protein [Streptacidiphilus carbonis]|uniref:hypothetical protein n=1 Tax=Streptacidiphilus carbonis TaxID=105422 RepID=UPI0005A83294|nr:hypothetical protein [Streptacidiphilus carbonis]
MSLDVSFTVSGAAVGAASLNLLRCAVRERGRNRPWSEPPALPEPSERSGRATANRLMAWALLLTLALGTVATLGWADDSIQGTQGLDRDPPLLGTAVLCAAGTVVLIAVNALARRVPDRPSAGRGAVAGRQDRWRSVSGVGR